jgi:hypothetical protein
VEITPSPEAAINLSNGPMENLDPLFARVVVLKSAETSLAIVSVDLIVFASRKVVAEAKARHGVAHVILCATHTHAAPAPEGLRIKPPLGDWTRKGDPGEELDWDALSADPWYAATEEKIITAIGEAAGTLFPATVTAGRGPFQGDLMAHNRRLVKDGKCVEMLWENPGRIPTEPLDPTVGVIRVADAAGKPRALLVHYACHPVGMMGAGFVSRDYPGVLCDTLEQELGGECMAMFLQGAAGDLDPFYIRGSVEDRLKRVRVAGIALGQDALRVAGSLPAASTRPASMVVRETVVSIPRRSGDKTTDVVMTTVVINGDLALVTMPGEPFIRHQLDLREASPVPVTFLLSLAYSGAGCPFLVYVPTEQAVAEGGYGATECSFVGADAGARMVGAAVTAIKTLVERTA